MAQLVPFGSLGTGDRWLDEAFQRLANATDISGKTIKVKVDVSDLRCVLAQFMVDDAKRVRS